MLNEKEFAKIVQKWFKKNNFQLDQMKGKRRETPLLNHSLFFDVKRSCGSHRPDGLLIQGDISIPYELKSGVELYKACRPSQAHLLSYFLQIIYGQCLGYADMFRSNDASLAIFLIIARCMRKDGFSYDVTNHFERVLTWKPKPYLKVMGLASVDFKAPEFSTPSDDGRYGLDCIDSVDTKILSTKIIYKKK